MNTENNETNGSNSKTLHEQDLVHFTGTQTWHRHPFFRSFTYTDGIQYLAEEGGAHWLVDKIFATQFENINLPEQSFQVWILEVRENHSAKLTCHDGDHNWQHEEEITFTDFPLKKIELWFSDNVLLLPSEY